MFLDEKNRFTTVEAEPFTLDHLIAWLEKRDPDEWYKFTSVRMCMLGQYTYENGGKICYSYDNLDGVSKYSVGDRSLPLNDLANGIPIHRVARELPHTFGAALERARALRNG